LKIGIDAREIEGEMTGIGRYLTGFIKYASKISHEYFLYYSRRPEIDLSCFNVKIRILKGSNLLWDHMILPKALNKDRIDLFFSPYYKKPWSLKCKSIITVNDLNPLFNENSSFWYRIYFKKIIKRSLDSVDFVLVLSTYVKEQILKFFGIDKSKIIVNSAAVDNISFHRIRNEASFRVVLEKYGIESDYILYIGNLMPHKNVSSLIKAYSELSEDIKNKYKLVIGGSKNWTYRQLVKLVDRLGLVNNVIFTGFIFNDDLIYLYNAASLFVFPSFKEGFGLPPLEAMACGVPVIASNVTSLPEVIGDAGILVNPYNIQELAKAISVVLTQEYLRRSLIEKGLERANRFSIEKMGSRILEIFEKLID
jgi:glycosyltransferase involved in cell wall biosynthesis